MTLIRNLIVSLSLVGSLVGCSTLSSAVRANDASPAVQSGQAVTVDTANAADAVIQDVHFA